MEILQKKLFLYTQLIPCLLKMLQVGIVHCKIGVGSNVCLK